MQPVLCFLLISLSLNSGQIAQDMERDLTALAQQATSDAATVQIIALGRQSEEANKVLSKRLPAMLLDATSPLPVLYNELSVAAQLHMLSAVPAMIELLGQNNTRGLETTISQRERLWSDPVGGTLWAVGGPQVLEALAGAIESGDRSKRYRTIRVLTHINTAQSRNILDSHLHREEDPALRQLIIDYGKGKKE